jgi:hypothetical protein
VAVVPVIPELAEVLVQAHLDRKATECLPSRQVPRHRSAKDALGELLPGEGPGAVVVAEAMNRLLGGPKFFSFGHLVCPFKCYIACRLY